MSIEKTSCRICSGILLRNSFYSPRDYESCLSYIKELLSSGNYRLTKATCDIDKVKNSGGWADDIICHELQCKKCGQIYTCICDTYHGNGEFREGR